MFNNMQRYDNCLPLHYTAVGMDKKDLFEKVKPLVEHNNLTVEQKAKLYDDWSATYDETVHGLEFSGPEKCAEVVCKYFPENRENVVVFDVGTGTGLAAEEMLKRGFKIFDGLDPSQGMLKEAEKKNIFRHLFCSFVTSEPISTLLPNSYDLLTVVGSYNHGHIPYDAIREMIRLTKPGGIICIVNRRSPFLQLPEYVDNFFPLCDQLEQEGQWKKEEITTFSGFIGEADGIVIIYRVK